MTADFYSLLPYCLRSYVDGKKWKEFRDVQIRSFKVLFDSDDHLLISSGTSSGKTEAAMFPVITDIYRNRPKRISALYISPLIALIDDQHDRVSRMLKDSEINLYSWHGGISSSTKKKILESGDGILQITPESLESVVNKHYDRVADMFSELKYVIIDEIHTFMNSDRGLHLLCELESIEHISECHPRRIGLSATLSDYSIAEEWLKANTGRNVSLVECETRPDYELTVTFDTFAPKKSPERQTSLRRFYERLFESTDEYNCLVFTNNRTSVENTAANLKKIYNERGLKKDILAHHSSISKEYRTLAEERMKDPEHICTAIATSTLELGIDVGDLDRVVHINAPHNVSSFIQKFGRSGRRDGHPVMVCFCSNKYNTKLPEGIEADLIRMIAETQLYFKEHWIEPIRYSHLPYSLLFQQTVSYVRSRITATSDELERNVLGLFPFREISFSDYTMLLDYMIECKVLDYNSYHGTYCLDSIGDRISKESEFGSNFTTIKEFEVYNGRERIGTIQSLPSVGENIQLAGSSWEVMSIDSKYSRALVKPSTKITETFWKSGGADTHTKMMQSMYDCLNEEEEYSYLDDRAKQVLRRSRQVFKDEGLNRPIVEIDGASHLFPWLGTIQFDTLFRILQKMGIADVSEPPFSIIIKEGVTIDQIRRVVQTFIREYDVGCLVADSDVMYSQILGKYSRYIPVELLKKQFIEDRLDLNFSL